MIHTDYGILTTDIGVHRYEKGFVGELVEKIREKCLKFQIVDNILTVFYEPMGDIQSELKYSELLAISLGVKLNRNIVFTNEMLGAKMTIDIKYDDRLLHTGKFQLVSYHKYKEYGKFMVIVDSKQDKSMEVNYCALGDISEQRIEFLGNNVFDYFSRSNKNTRSLLTDILILCGNKQSEIKAHTTKLDHDLFSFYAMQIGQVYKELKDNPPVKIF